MRLYDFLKMVPALYASRTSVLLLSKPGVGKSDAIRYDLMEILAKHLGSEGGYNECLAPTVDAAEVSGFTVPHKLPDGTAVAYQLRSYLAPPQSLLDSVAWGVNNIEELGAGDQLTQKALANTLLMRKFGSVELPNSWWMLATSNRVSDKAGAAKILSHVVNRLRVIEIQPDIFSWAVWAERKGLHPMGIAFAKARPGVIFGDDVKAAGEPFCSPRSYTSALRLIAQAAGTDAMGNPNMTIPDSTLLQECVAGDVGTGASAEMFAYFKVADKVPTITEIEANPQDAKCPIELDAAYAAMQMCVHHATPKNIDKLWTYAERFPKELQVSAAKALVERGGGVLVNSKALGQWIMKNRALIINTLD